MNSSKGTSAHMILSALFQNYYQQLDGGNNHDTYTIITTRTNFIRLVSVAEQNIALIDETIDFAGSERATQILGEEGAANLLQHAKDIKAQGAEFCDCPGCTAAKHIIDLKAEIEQ